MRKMPRGCEQWHVRTPEPQGEEKRCIELRFCTLRRIERARSRSMLQNRNPLIRCQHVRLRKFRSIRQLEPGKTEP